LELLSYVELPANIKQGGFDHAAIHRASGRLYVAHTANDALDVIDCLRDCYLHSIQKLPGVAGALVTDEKNLVFSSNRGENTVGIFAVGHEADLVKVPVGTRPNGLAYDSRNRLLLAANVGDRGVAGSLTLSMVDVEERRMIASIPVRGRTRWTVFDAQAETFYVNIAEPAQILVVDSNEPSRIARTFTIPVAGPHGLDIDAEHRRLFCACDAKKLVTLDADSGKIMEQVELSGSPDVVFFNRGLKRLYVAIGVPGVIDVFDTEEMMIPLETIPTEVSAHTIGFDPERNKVYAFLPETHRAAVYADID
jgi:DNA-binding beta-propeller fold protein YncE